MLHTALLIPCDFVNQAQPRESKVESFGRVYFSENGLSQALFCDILSIIMETASVADLRNHFSTVSRWIYEGKSVAIQKRGKAFAILTPARSHKKKTVPLPDYEVRLQKIFGDTPHRGATAEELVDYLRGEY
jgi:antitoxin (DNA-binding transcriptional repressor) of toxin-antitoxin stability system